MKSKYSDTYFAFQYAVKHKDYTKWFSPVILAVDTWGIHVWQTEATRARCYLRREREGVKTQHNWHNSLACQRSPVYSAALSAVLTYILNGKNAILIMLHERSTVALININVTDLSPMISPRKSFLANLATHPRSGL